MSIVTVSPKFQIVIPKEIRRVLKLRPGQRAEVFVDAARGRIEVVPRRPMREFRGLLKGIDRSFDRDREWGKDRV